MSEFGEMQDLLQDFLTEAGELLEDVDSKLVELEKSPHDNGLLNTVFRGFHTIKGGAGFLEAHAMVELCHKTENMFDLLRSEKLKLTPEMMDLILAATGEVRRMFSEMAGGVQAKGSPSDLLSSLDAAVEGRPYSYSTHAGALLPVAKEAHALVVPNSEDKVLTPDLKVSPSQAGDFDWPGLYTAVVGVPPKEQKCAQLEAKMVTETVSRQAASTIRNNPVETKSTKPAASQQPAAATAAKDSSIRVDTARFDQILNLSGEIGLTKNRLNCLRQVLVKGGGGDDDEDTKKTLDTVIGQLDMLVSDLQSAVMKARMQPVGRVFQKYSRLARDVARQLGKEVELVISGADTEVDKTILEELNDPLIHLVRNSCDHGIESIEDRLAVGKPAKGTVTLSACQTGDSIVIEITDDGRGMDSDFLRSKAIEKGLISVDSAANLTAQECLQLIFLPGFSTKSEVTDLSGRGVGMDVVKTNIQRLNGRIDIKSSLGQGTRISVFLPLTLAILPVLMLKLEEQVYSLPLSSVKEIISITKESLQLVNSRPTLIVRGSVVPVIDLATLIGRESRPGNKVGVLAVSGDKEFVLMVDGLVGQDEVMIKPLEGVKPKGVAGATLSGEGLLVLVLELRELLEGVL